jgi:hypothetical protein
MIDAMAERYGMLPTCILEQATTFDLFVYDTIVGYKNAQIEKENEANGGPKAASAAVSEERLLAVVARTKERNEKK